MVKISDKSFFSPSSIVAELLCTKYCTLYCRLYCTTSCTMYCLQYCTLYCKPYFTEMSKWLGHAFRNTALLASSTMNFTLNCKLEHTVYCTLYSALHGTLYCTLYLTLHSTYTLKWLAELT